jgi:hypothetical protein
LAQIATSEQSEDYGADAGKDKTAQPVGRL